MTGLRHLDQRVVRITPSKALEGLRREAIALIDEFERGEIGLIEAARWSTELHHRLDLIRIAERGAPR